MLKAVGFLTSVPVLGLTCRIPTKSFLKKLIWKASKWQVTLVILKLVPNLLLDAKLQNSQLNAGNFVCRNISIKMKLSQMKVLRIKFFFSVALNQFEQQQGNISKLNLQLMEIFNIAWRFKNLFRFRIFFRTKSDPGKLFPRPDA